MLPNMQFMPLRRYMQPSTHVTHAQKNAMSALLLHRAPRQLSQSPPLQNAYPVKQMPPARRTPRTNPELPATKRTMISTSLRSMNRLQALALRIWAPSTLSPWRLQASSRTLRTVLVIPAPSPLTRKSRRRARRSRVPRRLCPLPRSDRAQPAWYARGRWRSFWETAF